MAENGATSSAPTPDSVRSAIAAVVLAAGMSRRMGEQNKLLAPIQGVPMLVRVVEGVLASQAHPAIVVTGHDRAAVEAAVAHLPVRVAHNPACAAGLSRSLAVGLAAVPGPCPGALICLGDMPQVPPAVLNALIAAFDPAAGRAICVPVVGEERGNPVLWARRFFPEMAALTGDTGARSLLACYETLVCRVPVLAPGVLEDIDSPADFVAVNAHGLPAKRTI